MTNNDPDGTSSRKVRQYSPEYVGEYMKHTLKNYVYKTIFVDDDTFNIGNKHTIEMSKVFGKTGLPGMLLSELIRVKKMHGRL